MKLILISLMGLATAACANSSGSYWPITEPKNGYAIVMGPDTWVVKPNLDLQVAEIIKLSGDNCQSWIGPLKKEMWQLAIAGPNYYKDHSTSELKIIENSNIISFQPLVTGNPCKAISTDYYFKVEGNLEQIVDKVRVQSASTVYGTKYTGAEWEYPSDFYVVANKSISPLFASKSNSVVGVAITTEAIHLYSDYVRYVKINGSSAMYPSPENFDDKIGRKLIVHHDLQTQRINMYDFIVTRVLNQTTIQEINKILSKAGYTTLLEEK